MPMASSASAGLKAKHLNAETIHTPCRRGACAGRHVHGSHDRSPARCSRGHGRDRHGCSCTPKKRYTARRGCVVCPFCRSCVPRRQITFNMNVIRMTTYDRAPAVAWVSGHRKNPHAGREGQQQHEHETPQQQLAVHSCRVQSVKFTPCLWHAHN